MADISSLTTAGARALAQDNYKERRERQAFEKYRRKPKRYKSKMAQVEKPHSVADMYRKSERSEARYWERADALDRGESPPKRKREVDSLRELARKKLYVPAMQQEWLQAAEAIYDSIDKPLSQLDIANLTTMSAYAVLHKEKGMIGVLEGIENVGPSTLARVGVAMDILHLLQDMREDGSLQYLKPRAFHDFIVDLYARHRKMAENRDMAAEYRTLVELERYMTDQQ